jgi:hypothetical protein
VPGEVTLRARARLRLGGGAPAPAHVGGLLCKLPDELVAHILAYLSDAREADLGKLVCRAWNAHLCRAVDVARRNTRRTEQAWWHARMHRVSWAAAEGHVPLLEWALAAGTLRRAPWGPLRIPADVIRYFAGPCAAAAGAGRLGVLEWLRAHGCALEGEAVVAAAHGGHLDVLEYLAGHIPHLGGRGKEAILAAAAQGHTHVLPALHASRGSPAHAPCAAAAGGGHLKTLAWLRASGYPCGVSAIISSAAALQLEALLWVLEHNPHLGATLRAEVERAAEERGYRPGTWTPRVIGFVTARLVWSDATASWRRRPA